MHDLIYLASPYSKHPHGVNEAFREVCIEAARLIEAGFVVYSPIAHSHPVAVFGGLDPQDHEMWMKQCRAMLPRVDCLVALKMLGWETSLGMAEEIQATWDMGKKVFYMEPGRLPADLIEWMGYPILDVPNEPI